MFSALKPVIAAVGIALFSTSLPALADAPKIKTVNGVASYPEGYQGTPVRAADEDPFLSPSNSALILIDYQPPILAGVKNIDHETLINNTTGLIKTAVIYDIPIIFSHVAVGLNGYDPMIEELQKLAPNAVFIDRTSVNAWEEPEFVEAVKATGRKKLIMGGLWTDVCLAYPAIEAEAAGYDVYVPEDAVGSITQLSHENGMRRMIEAGVEPITWNVVPAELQRDHARTDKLQAVTRVFMEHLFKVDPDQTW
ncbi:Isochorismatase family protein [Pseudovibrio sp. Ad46]|uniref:hydrolase n=1 Tax=unclassified Pseudovibrio TaxID=2627060 RepID=UPI0007AECDBB|nr:MULTISPECIES: hydrolase [unclassified Pseudovibrio]KZK89381.1 Isochorismatase family protein [Pseudovibrio sp. Ad46]KZL01295.1 Isochorismatase family protein [Pseudovibrio sp. W74]KZL08896.1 Isochorismatase family protein [Pseudovibrio sp. Ad14]